MVNYFYFYFPVLGFEYFFIVLEAFGVEKVGESERRGSCFLIVVQFSQPNLIYSTRIWGKLCQSSSMAGGFLFFIVFQHFVYYFPFRFAVHLLVQFKCVEMIWTWNPSKISLCKFHFHAYMKTCMYACTWVFMKTQKHPMKKEKIKHMGMVIMTIYACTWRDTMMGWFGMRHMFNLISSTSHYSRIQASSSVCA